jgi:uncharacterized membrane protein YheB (UPF0754 family)
MMHTILLMILIGAAIGGVTNHLAIKMLFRPYQELYIGKWRVPFTPGIIPRRRKEMSVQLGDMVVKHLLTSESIQRKLKEEEFREKIVYWAKREAFKMVQSKATLREVVQKQFGISDLEGFLKDKSAQFACGFYEDLLKAHSESSIRDVIPMEVNAAVKGKFPLLSEIILKRAELYIASEDSNLKIQTIIDQILEEKKVINGLVGLFVKNDDLLSKVKTEIIHILNKDSTKATLHDLFEKEWSKVKEKHIIEILPAFEKSKIEDFIGNKVINTLPLADWLDKSINSWSSPYQDKIVNEFLPNLLEKVGLLAVQKVDKALEHFDISNIVKKQVEGFPVERLEQLILGIVNKEFKMITYLGGFLGGIVGLIQGLLVIYVV